MSDYNIVLYSRLSSEDIKKGEQDTSNSIANQKKLLDDFVKNHEELSNCKTIHIWDDGYSGTNFDRPGAKKMLDMARRQEIQCIIVKDLSRLGRNYIEVGSYVEEIFPFLGIRFISVNDFFDSKYNTAAGSLDIGFKNLMHDNYAQVTSRKVSEAKILRTKMGMVVNSFAFFGYLKEGYSLVIDEPAAKTIRYLRDLRLQKKSLVEIARIMNAEGWQTPQDRNRELGVNLFLREGKNYWTSMMVGHILSDERYTGKNIYRKTKRKGSGTFERMKAPKEEHIVIPDAFPAIFTQEEFDELRSIKAVRRKKDTAPEKPKMFQRIIKCGICGKTLSMRSGETRNYYCAKSYYVPEAECADLKISEAELIKVVLKSIHLQADVLLDYKDRKQAEAVSQRRVYEKQIYKFQTVLNKKDAVVFDLYEKYKSNAISRDEFLSERSRLENDTLVAKAELEKIESKLHEILETEHLLENSAFDNFSKYKDITELNKEIINALISRITVYSADRVEIEWKYQDLW